MPDTNTPRTRAPATLPIHRWSLTYLTIPPVLLTVAFVITTVVASLHDVNPGMLYSQCHARAVVPWLSRVPVLGAPACYLVMFFHYALDSFRSAAVLAEILVFVGSLVTVCTLEAARMCNRGATLIENPTGPWLMLNLAGGQVVWGLVIVPAFLRRSKAIAAAVESSAAGGDGRLAVDARNLVLQAEAVAVPVAVVLGCFVPSLLMALFNHPVVVFVWLFFPVYVSLIRQFVRWAVLRASTERFTPAFRVEKSRIALVGVYAAPVICSVLAHVWVLVSLLRPDDRREMTRSMAKFIEIDASFIGATALYLILVEGGWRPAVAGGLVSVILGPGAGVCAAWLYREWTAHGSTFIEPEIEGGEERRDEQAGEETPLLG